MCSCWFDEKSSFGSGNSLSPILQQAITWTNDYAIHGYTLVTRGNFYSHGLTLIKAWKSNSIPYKVWDETT